MREVSTRWEVDDVTLRLLGHLVLKKLSWTIVGVLTAVLGLSGPVLGASWGHLGQMWGHLGATLGLGNSIFVREMCSNWEVDDLKLRLL